MAGLPPAAGVVLLPLLLVTGVPVEVAGVAVDAVVGVVVAGEAAMLGLGRPSSMVAISTSNVMQGTICTVSSHLYLFFCGL